MSNEHLRLIIDNTTDEAPDLCGQENNDTEQAYGRMLDNGVTEIIAPDPKNLPENTEDAAVLLFPTHSSPMLRTIMSNLKEEAGGVVTGEQMLAPYDTIQLCVRSLKAVIEPAKRKVFSGPTYHSKK